MAVFTVSILADTGTGSLRDAITKANGSADPTNTINFDPNLGFGATILPATALPSITKAGTTIDGTLGFGGRAVISGANPTTPPPGDGLTLTAANCVVQNLVISGFRGAGINLGGFTTATPPQPAGLGGTTKVLGTSIRNNTGAGISISSANNSIGGSTLDGTGNVISNNQSGINITTSNFTFGGLNTVIQGNTISNSSQYGISSVANRGILVGGEAPGQGNVVTSSGLAGIQVVERANVFSNRSITQISGNRVGITANGTASGNGFAVGGVGGIVIIDADGAIVGDDPSNGTDPSAGNTVAFNTGSGVVVIGGTSDSILSNSIYSNTGLGIDLRNNANNSVTPPILDSILASSASSSTLIQGRFNGQSFASYRIQFFSNTTTDASGKDGRTLIGQLDVTAGDDTSGTTFFSTTVPTFVTPGAQVTATLTQLDFFDTPSDTSQFSGSVVEQIADLAAFLTVLPPKPVPLNTQLSFVVTVANLGPNVSNHPTARITLPAGLTNVSGSLASGSVSVSGNIATVTFDTTLPFPASVPINFTATATQVGTFPITATVGDSGGEFDPDTSNNSVTDSFDVAFSADLGVTIAPPSGLIQIGQSVQYTVVVTNNGPSDATSAVLTDVVPAGLDYDPSGSSTNSGSLAFLGGTVTATLGTLKPGESATIILAFTPRAAGAVTNSVSVSNAAEVDVNPSNNTASTTIAVSPSDIGVAIQRPSDPLSIGVPAVYTILVTNNGPADAPGVVLSDVLGSGATIVGATVPQGTYTIDGNTLTANLGTLAAGQTIAIQLTVNPTVSGILGDEAAVATGGFDPNPANNLANATNQVSPADLAVTVVGAPSPVLLGLPTTYTVTVFNGGPSTARNVIVSDLLPSNATLVSVTTSQGAVSGAGTLNATLGDLASGASATLTIIVIPNAVGPVANAVSVASDNYDPNPANNSATGTVTSFNQPGSFVLVPGSASVNENAGTITFTVQRVLGSLGTVSVDYATADLTGLAGLNYVATAGTLVFADGELSKQLTIPILDDNIIGGDVNFLLSLTNPAGGAALSGQAAAVVTVVNTDRDFVAPKVVSVVPIGTGAGITGFVITFDDAMDPTRVTNLDNYRITLSGRDPGSRAGSNVQLSGAVFDPVARTVTLSVVGTLPNNRFYDVELITTGSQPIADTSGNVLDGNADGVAGGDYETLIGQGNNLKYRDARGNIVTLTLRKGGTMNVIRDQSGNAASVALSGIVPHRSTLSGRVKRPRHGGGRVTIGTISGLRKFGDVRSNLTTAPFFATFAPVNVDGQIKSNTASAATPTGSSAALKAARALAVRSAHVPNMSSRF